MMKVLVSYPTEDEELVIVERMTGRPGAIQAIVSPGQLMDMRKEWSVP